MSPFLKKNISSSSSERERGGRERYHVHVIHVSCIDLLIIASHALIFEIIRHVVRQKVKIPMLSEIKK